MKDNFKDASIEIYAAEKKRPKSSKRQRTEDDVRKELFAEEEQDEGDQALPENIEEERVYQERAVSPNYEEKIREE